MVILAIWRQYNRHLPVCQHRKRTKQAKNNFSILLECVVYCIACECLLLFLSYLLYILYFFLLLKFAVLFQQFITLLQKMQTSMHAYVRAADEAYEGDNEDDFSSYSYVWSLSMFFFQSFCCWSLFVCHKLCMKKPFQHT